MVCDSLVCTDCNVCRCVCVRVRARASVLKVPTVSRKSRGHQSRTRSKLAGTMKQESVASSSSSHHDCSARQLANGLTCARELSRGRAVFPVVGVFRCVISAEQVRRVVGVGHGVWA
jgi:hypothetical protein